MPRKPTNTTKLRKPKGGSNVKVTKDRPNEYSYDFTIKGERFRGPTHTTSLEEAERFVAKERQHIYDEEFLDRKPQIQFEAAMIRYFQEYGKEMKSYKTIFSRLKHFKEFFIKVRGIKQLHDLRDDDVWAYVVYRRQKRRPSPCADNNNSFISDATIAKELHSLNNLNSMARDMWRVEAADFSISLHKKNLQKSEPLINYIELDKQRFFIESLPHYLRAPLLFSIMTGLRWGNVRDFRTSQIQWEHNLIRFNIKSRIYKEGKLHYVPITDDMHWLLGILDITPATEDRLVFTYGDGLPLGTHRKAIDTAYQKAGIKRLKGQCIHLLRHTAGTNFTAATGDIRTTQELLGHQSIKTTTIYSHVLPSRKISAINAAASHFGHMNLTDDKTEEE